jgi:predicted permease
MINDLLYRLRALVRRSSMEADLERELREHLEHQVEKYVRSGMPREEAERLAKVELGGLEQVKEECRDSWGVGLITELQQDLRYGLRQLRRRPGFTAVAVITLALGIGANTAIFTLLYGLLLRSLPVAQPWRLARVSLKASLPREGVRDIGLFWQMAQQLRRQQQSFTDISAWLEDVEVYARDSTGTVRMYPGTPVSGNGFGVLGVKPYLGRMLVPSDDVSGGPPQGWPVVLSYGFWNDRFARDPQVIGKRMDISNVPFTVVGVAPKEFQGVQAGVHPQMYFPMHFVEVLFGGFKLDAPESLMWCETIGRLKPGVTLARANAEIATYKDALLDGCIPQKYRDAPFVHILRDSHLQVTSGRSGIPFDNRSILGPLWLLQGLVGVVLVLCCVNVGGLMLARTHERRHEFAVRNAVGAGRWRLVRQYLTESFLIAAAGALLGAFLAWKGSQALLAYFIDPNSEWGLTVPADQTVFLATAILAVLATLLFGTVPAWLASRSNLAMLLKSRTSAGRRQIAGRAFVPIQVALSLVLVAVAGLLSESLIRMRSEHLGFDIDHITFTCSHFADLPQKGDARLDLYQKMIDRLNGFPGIISAAITFHTPFDNRQLISSFEALSEGPSPPQDKNMAWNDVGPGYFRTTRLPILAGREFEPRDRDRSHCILNQSAAAYLFPHQPAIGQYVRSTDKRQFPEGFTCQVIGLAEDAKYGMLRERPPRTIYFPVNKDSLRIGLMVFLMRSAHEAEAVAAYRKTLAEFAPTTALTRFVTLRQQRDETIGSQRLVTLLSNFFAVLALLLSAIGLYGLLASSVAQRTSEIGVRLALGAQRGGVVRMILYEALRLVVAGIVLGAVALLFVVRFVRDLLYGISAFNPATLACTVALLGAVAFLAALVPACRAAALDPMEALRLE